MPIKEKEYITAMLTITYIFQTQKILSIAGWQLAALD